MQVATEFLCKHAPIPVQTMFNYEMRRILILLEDWNLIGGLGDEVPQKQKLFSY